MTIWPYHPAYSLVILIIVALYESAFLSLAIFNCYLTIIKQLFKHHKPLLDNFLQVLSILDRHENIH